MTDVVDEYAELFKVEGSKVEDLYLTANKALLARLYHFDQARWQRFKLDRQGWKGTKDLWVQIPKLVKELDLAHEAKTKEAVKEQRLEALQDKTVHLVDPMDKLALAKLVRDTRAPHLIHTNGTWLNYTGTHYEPVEDKQVRRWIYATLRQCVNEVDALPIKPDDTAVSKVYDALVASTFHAKDLFEPPVWLKMEPGDHPAHEYIVCKNTMLHLPTGEERPLTPRFFTYTALDFEYWPPELCLEPDTWHALLNFMWPNEPDSIATLQEIMGYMLTADTSLQKIFLLVGPPRAGKGVVGRILIQLLGHRNVASPTPRSVSGAFGKQTLIGKLLWYIPDLRLGKSTDMTELVTILLSISGQDTFSIDRKYTTAWEGSLQARAFLVTNEVPRFPDASGAMMARMVTLVTERSVEPGKEDPHLSERIIASEMPAILNWAIEGWKRLQARGHFVVPATGAALNRRTAAYTASVRTFLQECCTQAPGTPSTKTQDLHAAYEAWNELNDIGRPMTDAQFGREIASASGFKIKRVRHRTGEDHAQEPHYSQVALLPEYAHLMKFEGSETF